MRFNIFRNRSMDAQVGYLLDSFDQAVRNKTEEYWRNVIAEEIKDYAEDLLADIDYDYGQGNEYDACNAVLRLVEYVVRNKKLPPLGEL